MIPAFTLRRYLELMSQRGFASAEVLANTHVDAARLQDKTYLIHTDQRKAVIANMLALTDNPALGFEFGRATRISQLGAFGHVLLSSHSIWEQYRLWLQYAEPLLGFPMSVNIEKHASKGWSWSYRDPIATGAEHIFSVEELLMISYKSAQSLNGEPMRLSGLKLDYAAPLHHHLYAEIFQCPVEFGCSQVEMQAISPMLEEIFPGPDAEFAETCLSYCSRQLHEVNAPLSLSDRLQSTFAAHLGKLPSIEEAARMLGMSERTLRRRLADEGLGFQEVFNRFRRDAAIQYLRARKLKPKEIGHLLGFSFTTDFRRAFKSWTGQSISDYLLENEGESDILPGG